MVCHGRTYRYEYDGWNRLVKAASAEDVTVVVGTYTYYPDGRRATKEVGNSGSYATTEIYYYNGQQLIEVRNGSEQVVQQLYHGTQYIDEVIAEQLDDGVAFVHQDRNWNVIALTDWASKVIERVRQTPYGVITVDQETYFVVPAKWSICQSDCI